MRRARLLRRLLAPFDGVLVLVGRAYTARDYDDHHHFRVHAEAPVDDRLRFVGLIRHLLAHLLSELPTVAAVGSKTTHERKELVDPPGFEPGTSRI